MCNKKVKHAKNIIFFKAKNFQYQNCKNKSTDSWLTARRNKSCSQLHK